VTCENANILGLRRAWFGRTVSGSAGAFALHVDGEDASWVAAAATRAACKDLKSSDTFGNTAAMKRPKSSIGHRSTTIDAIAAPCRHNVARIDGNR
jgi:hypothetical protein